MIQLKDILYKVAIDKVIGNTSVAIRNIEFDSRKIQLNDVHSVSLNPKLYNVVVYTEVYE